MRILVTGTAGFIGYHLCHRLLSQGSTVTGLDNFYSGQKTNISDLKKEFPQRFSFYESDICDPLPQDLQASPFEQVYHLACPASPPAYQKDPLFTLDTCYVGTKRMLVFATEKKARILFSSTSEIYGDPLEHPQKEHYFGNVHTTGPRSCYDEGKRIAETLAYNYQQQKNTQIRIARIFNTYGPRMSRYDGRVLTNFITQALQKKPLTVYGDGTQTRSFCYVDDMVSGLMKLMASQVTHPVNLGSEFEVSIDEICDRIRNILDPKLMKEYHPLPQDDPKTRRPCLALAENLLGWRPQTTLEQGLDRMISFLRNDTINSF